MGRKAETFSLSLRLIEETSTTVIGEDESGDRRLFQKADLQSCIVSRRFESVSIVIEWRKLKKIKPMNMDVSPASEKPVVLKKRRCLNCRHEFDAHPSIFICEPCKRATSWRMGGDYSVCV
jgi:hypothetical protein